MDRRVDYNEKYLSFLISLIPKLEKNGEISDLQQDLLLKLPRFYLNEDTDISTESIRASGIRDNIFAVESLFKIIEEGNPKIQIEAIKALGKINPPLIHERLIEYYSLLKDEDVRKEILKLLNRKYYKHKEVINLNRGIVSDSGNRLDFKIFSVSGLVKSRDFSFLSYVFPYGEERLIEEILENIVEQNGVEVEEFLKRQEANLDYFSDRILGYFLCAYTLKVSGVKSSLINRILDEKNVECINAYLDLCEKFLYQSSFLKRLFRILLSFPVIESQDVNSIEKRIRGILKKIIEQAFGGSINDVKELTLTCNVQLSNLFRNIVASHISLSGVKSKYELYSRIMAQLFEKFLPSELLTETIDYFSRNDIENASLLVTTIMQFAKTVEDKKLIEACVPLFYVADERRRLKIYTILKKVKPEVRIITGRIARIIYSLAALKSKSSAKKIEEVYIYSKEEKLRIIEAESIIALSVVKPGVVKERIKSLLTFEEDRNVLLLKAALKSLNSLTRLDLDRIITEGFILTLDSRDMQEIFLDSMLNINYKLPNKVLTAVINSMSHFAKYSLLDRAVYALSEKGDWTVFNALKPFMQDKPVEIKIACIEILRGLKRRDVGIKSELIVNYLYSLIRENGVKDNGEFYSSIVSFLMELNDDYSFRIFESLAKENNYKLILKIIKKLPHHIFKKLFFIMAGIAKNIDSENLKELKDCFARLPVELFDEGMKNFIYKEFKECYERDKTIKVSDTIRDETESVSLVERPKVEFKIQYEQMKEVAVFFIDIANYTTLSSKLSLTGLMKIVNNFEKVVISTVEDFNGRIIKKMGDGILAVFNHPLNSVVGGLIIQEKIRDYNDFVPLNEKFNTRIGIHMGSVVFKDNDVFGDTVNIASRIESKADPGSVLVSEVVYNLTRNFIEYKNIGPLQLKGVSNPTNSYMPINLTEDLMKYLEIKDSNISSLLNSDIRGNVARKLRVIMFNPDFSVPEDVNINYNIKELKELFENFTRYVESFAKDYLEEYEIKAWLQNKWNNLLIKKR